MSRHNYEMTAGKQIGQRVAFDHHRFIAHKDTALVESCLYSHVRLVLFEETIGHLYIFLRNHAFFTIVWFDTRK